MACRLAGPGSVAQLIDQIAARWKSIFGVLGQGPGDDGPVVCGSGSSLGLLRWCCITSCAVFLPENGRTPVSSSWKTMARLYWSLRRLGWPVKLFRRGIKRVSADERYGRVLDVFYQSEIGNLDAAAENQRFSGLMSRCWSEKTSCM